MQDLDRFVGPRAACSAPAPGRILTSVGNFPAAGVSHAYEIVADTKLERTVDGVRYADPSITVFDDRCEPVWRQSFPDLGEIGFDILEVPSGPQILDRGGLDALHLPGSPLPPFPLHRFVFGD